MPEVRLGRAAKRAVGLAAPAATDTSALDAFEPLVADCLERPARRGDLREPLRALAGAPSQARTSRNFAPWGTPGDTNVRNGGVRVGPLGSDQPKRFCAKPLQTANRPTARMPEEGLETPDTGL
jgi:hypothetical protein